MACGSASEWPVCDLEGDRAAEEHVHAVPRLAPTEERVAGAHLTGYAVASTPQRSAALTSRVHSHVGRLKSLGLSPHGDASIQNALDVAVRGLSFVPPYGHREVLFVSTSLTSCDPGDVFASIKHAAKQNCRCSVVGLGAEVVRREHAHVFPALPIDRSDLTPTIQSAFPLSHQMDIEVCACMLLVVHRRRVVVAHDATCARCLFFSTEPTHCSE